MFGPCDRDDVEQKNMPTIVKREKQPIATKEKYEPGKPIKFILFSSNFFLVLFLGKRIMSPPGSNIDFLLKNLGSFIASGVLTGIMLYFLERNGLIIAMIAIWIAILLLAIR